MNLEKDVMKIVKNNAKKVNERKKISSQVKTIYNKTFITISIVFDKRWKTYICIFCCFVGP